MTLPKYSMGIGDRFAHAGSAQLDAFVQAARQGVQVAPVWNKSNREHNIIGTEPASVRIEADAAVQQFKWSAPYFVDADHIGLKTVDRFLAASDFFTLDVADFSGKPADDAAIAIFTAKASALAGTLNIPGIDRALEVTPQTITSIARKYLLAVQEAGRIYRHITAAKDASRIVVEVSMDETDFPQTPLELLFILLAIAQENIPAQTIAPKFTGRFNKGIDYVGDLAKFKQEFNDDLAVIAFAVKQLGLPANLKLSVHSGSDKFSIYPIMREAMVRFDAGLHLKTAGTTWLEELIGLAESEGEGLAIAKEVYVGALARYDEMCGPYATVIDIVRPDLPTPTEVGHWTGQQYAAALRHDQSCRDYNPSFRQLLHVGYKVAAEMGSRFTGALERNSATIARNVTTNILDRHLLLVFPAGAGTR